MMMLMLRRHIGGVVVSFRAFLVAAYRGGGGDFFPAARHGVGRSRMT